MHLCFCICTGYSVRLFIATKIRWVDLHSNLYDWASAYTDEIFHNPTGYCVVTKKFQQIIHQINLSSTFVHYTSKMSSKRKCFSVKEKMQIIRRLKAGERNVTLAREFNVRHTTIATIQKNAEKIKALFNSNILKPKRVRASTQDQVDKALFQWCIEQSSQGILFSGPMLQKQANFFAQQFKIENFCCSGSWISRFKVRHNIVDGAVSREPLSDQESDVSEGEGLTKVCPKEELDEYVLTDNGVAICAEPSEDIIVKVEEEELDEFIPIDVAISEEPFEDSIVKNIVDDGQDSDDNVADQNETVSDPSVLEAFKAAEILNRFVHSNFNDESLRHSMSLLNNAVRDCFYKSKTTAKQSKITEYFN